MTQIGRSTRGRDVEMLIRFAVTISVAALMLSGCGNNEPRLTNVYGTYTPVSTSGRTHYWEGDVVTLSPEGYRHSRFTDELGPWLEEPPYQEYGGEVIFDGNRLVFVESWLEPPERYFVEASKGAFLLTPKDYRSFEESGKLPDDAMKKRETTSSQ